MPRKIILNIEMFFILGKKTDKYYFFYYTFICNGIGLVYPKNDD